jgi:hypothetical protein
MITMLNSWSFDLNSNKSFGTPDPSIPVPSHDHSARQSPSMRAAGTSVYPIAAARIERPVPFLPSPLGGERARVRGVSTARLIPALTRTQKYISSVFRLSSSVNSVNGTYFNLCNPLIARVRTVSHVNKKFLFKEVQSDFFAFTHVTNP